MSRKWSFERGSTTGCNTLNCGVARLGGTSGVRCILRPGDQLSAVAGFPPTTHLLEPFQPRVGGSNVADDFDHTIDGITCSTGASVEVAMSSML